MKERQHEESYRHGKVLFAKLNGGHGWVWFHFGMTGFLTYGNDREKDIEDHVRLLLKFSNGHHLRFHCPRLFGQVGWIGGVEEYIQHHALGPDSLRIPESVFLQRAQNTRSLLKPMLMNQSVMAGIGNVYSDEICFRLVCTLSRLFLPSQIPHYAGLIGRCRPSYRKPSNIKLILTSSLRPGCSSTGAPGNPVRDAEVRSPG